MFIPRHSEDLGRVTSKARNGTKLFKNIVLQNSQNNLSVPQKSSFLTIFLGKSPVEHLSHEVISVLADSLFCRFEHRFTGKGKQAPFVQVQCCYLYVLTLCSQAPPFWQGKAEHSSMSKLQSFPVKPGWNRQVHHVHCRSTVSLSRKVELQ